MFKSLLGIVEDTARIVTAPVEVALDLTSAVTKPVADLSQDVVDEVKEATEDLNR